MILMVADNTVLFYVHLYTHCQLCIERKLYNSHSAIIEEFVVNITRSWSTVLYYSIYVFFKTDKHNVIDFIIFGFYRNQGLYNVLSMSNLHSVECLSGNRVPSKTLVRILC